VIIIETRKIKVLVVDDSLLFRETLAKCLGGGIIEVIGTAAHPYEARDKILELRPDVVTLDVEMPKMNGIQFLRKLIPQYPLPVVVVSALPINAFDALDAGAVDFVKKPLIKSPKDMMEFCEELKSKVVIAASVKVTKTGTSSPLEQGGDKSFSPLIKKVRNPDTIIALGASTGGTEALKTVLEKLPSEIPPIIIVQHMPAGFTKMYADRINRLCQFEVKEAEDGDRLRYGLCIVAAGEYHLTLKKDAAGYYIFSKRGEKVSGHCPSVDVMFSSVAEVAKDKAIGAILTGMGGDGARGLLEMKKQGAFTIGQDKESCVVYGMPMVAYNLGAVTVQAPLNKISEIIYNRLNG